METSVGQWRNRAVGEASVDPRELKENALNWRIHTAYQQEAMTDVLGEIGWLQPILVNQNTGVIVDGHMRWSLALKHKEETVPVRYVDLTQAEEDRILATLNPIASLAYEDAEARAELAKRVQFESEALRQLAGLVTAEDMSRDHTEVFGEDDEAEEDFDDFLDDAYGNEAIRLITFVMTVPEYEDSIDALERICDREGIDTNSDAVMWLIEQYGEIETEAPRE